MKGELKIKECKRGPRSKRLAILVVSHGIDDSPNVGLGTAFAEEPEVSVSQKIEGWKFVVRVAGFAKASLPTCKASTLQLPTLRGAFWRSSCPASWHPILTVTNEERQWMDLLCCLIRVEKDPAKFTMLVKELNELLQHGENRLRLEIREQDSNL